ncbi:copper chaperone CopZ [Bacillus sp. FJAT-45350]|uniref:copper chaperone CopZ n=1 Tax=Bacillus sp. FJAT-45350 TaxID=2011014 RepID=UPI000BB9690D|nr:copper chaperone CopZ [Bacillus sp. FJAT-45350]
MTKETIKVDGMSCGHCSAAVEGALLKINGVEKAVVSLDDKQVVIEFDGEKVNVDKLKNEIEDIGYDVVS